MVVPLYRYIATPALALTSISSGMLWTFIRCCLDAWAAWAADASMGRYVALELVSPCFQRNT